MRVDKIIFFILLAIMFFIIGAGYNPVFADNNLVETRYCGEPERDARGRIKRSQVVLDEFERLYPLPAGSDRKKWQANHALPLVCGGCDSISNLIWMRVEAKTCADDWCQDRHEQITMCPKLFHK